MILFLDTSALVKLYVVEADSPAIHAYVSDTHALGAVSLADPEISGHLAALGFLRCGQLLWRVLQVNKFALRFIFS